MTVSSVVAASRAMGRSSNGQHALQRWIMVRSQQLLAAVLLALLAPVMLVLSIWIWCTDGSPILFAHYRVGMNGKLFRCFKFRSMRRDADKVLAELLRTDAQARAEWAAGQKLRDDPRITRIGQFLRKSSLDELPQLFNVLRGEMLLVGPRPVTVPELVRYGVTRWHYLSVPPGITGLWQVSGRNLTSYEERVRLDRQYVETRSLWLDLRILARTVTVVITRHGAC